MKKTRCYSLIISTLIMSVSNYASADETKIYLGAGVGLGHFHSLSNIQDIESSDADAVASNLFLGYSFNDYLSVEGGYLYVGRGQTDSLPFKNQGGVLSLNGRVPLFGDLSFLAEAGGYWSHTDGLGTRDNKVSTILGTGLAYQINDQFDVQARWRYVRDMANLNSQTYQIGSQPNENVATLELVYHPFRSTKHEYIEPTIVDEPSPIQQEEFPVTIVLDKPFEFSAKVMFNLNQTSLSNEAFLSLDNLQQQLTEISTKKQMKTIVIGYSDSLGPKAIKDRVAKERAEAVASYLVHIGVPESQIHVQAKAISNSNCSDMSNKAEQITCMAPDRSVKIKITGYQEVEEVASRW
ncbi:hypothetical protein E4T16_14715 [Vibrio parahaemolyticus]|nr:outer membrane beta-barrel protein [Vibrio parahaemolyticus]EGR0686858.1 hypothetical protein [Vibrio parahaemolyticus]